MKTNKQKGFTLIEIMIAIVVFSFGLLGVAGILTVAVKSNHNGYMRSQASFMASSILDSMRRNVKAVWNGDYDVTVSGYSDISGLCTTTSPCNPAALAARDVQFWSNTFSAILPNSSGSIACVQEGALLDTTGQINAAFYEIEPYNGICTVTLTWTEANETSAESLQTLVIPGKP